MRLIGSAVALVAVVALAACTAAPSPSPATTGPSASSSASADASGPFAELSVYYPVAEGNTWVYSIDYGNGTVVTDTEVMSKVVAEDGGARATIERTFHYEDGSQADLVDTVDYVFHPDGSLEVPFQSIPTTFGVVTVKSGTMVWPTTAEFEAGTPRTGTIEASVDSQGTVTNEVVAFTIQGAGTESLTVTAGTYDARKLLQNLLISLPDLGVTDIPIDSTSWLVQGVGPVQTVVLDQSGGPTIVQQLVSFTPGA